MKMMFGFLEDVFLGASLLQLKRNRERAVAARVGRRTKDRDVFIAYVVEREMK